MSAAHTIWLLPKAGSISRDALSSMPSVTAPVTKRSGARVRIMGYSVSQGYITGLRCGG